VRFTDSFTQGLAVFVLATYVAALGARSWRESLWCGAGSITLLALQGYWDPRYVGAGAVIANTVYGVLVWSVAAAVRVHADGPPGQRCPPRLPLSVLSDWRKKRCWPSGRGSPGSFTTSWRTPFPLW